MRGMTKESWIIRKQKLGPSGTDNPSALATIKGKHHSEESKRKRSIISRKYFDNPENHAIFLEAHHKAFLGKPKTKEAKEKSSLTQRGYHNSTNTEFKVGHVHSGEVKKKISDSKQGDVPWIKGKCHSEGSNEANRLAHTGKKASDETKLKMRESHLKRYRANPELASYRVVALRHSEQGGVGYISRNQRLLYNFVKGEHSDAVLEFPIVTENSVRYADIGVASKKVDFEYDSDLHKQFKPAEEDARRDEELSKVGWVTVRFNDKEVRALVGGRLNC